VHCGGAGVAHTHTSTPVGGDRIDPETFPDSFVVDYVRAYR
jgi:hypothetical protein